MLILMSVALITSTPEFRIMLTVLCGAADIGDILILLGAAQSPVAGRRGISVV